LAAARSLKAILKETAGLGTGATRSSILKKLEDTGLVTIEKSHFIPTDFGMSLIDIIKIDFIDTTKEQRAAFAPPLVNAGKVLLAEKVETKEDVQEAMSLGCQLFQGYYFSKPIMMKKSSMEISSVSYMKLAKEINAPDINLNNIAWIINSDAHLTYKLLRRMKTLQYYRGNNITSINRALVMMGDAEVRRWIMLILLRNVTNTQSAELIRTALIRAFLSEKLAQGRCWGISKFRPLSATPCPGRTVS